LSFCTDIKEYLNGITEKLTCCQEAFDCGFNSRELSQECDKDISCFIRGVFIKNGYVSVSKKNTELTLSFFDDYIFYVNAVLESVGLEARITRRKNKNTLYYKGSEKIEDFLAFIGASKYALILMEQKVIKELRGNANRITNAETANLDRIAKAAAEQCDAIRLIIEKKEYAKLSSELKECADLRLLHPDMSLDELKMLFENPISKSGLNHRLKRLMEIAKNIKDRKD